MNFNFNSLKNAVESLSKGLNVVKRKNEEIDVDEFQLLRAGIIQNFEFTYELCWKFMKRWLEQNVSPDIADGVPRIHFFRISAQHKLINDVEKWMSFHRARNKTSHVYDEEIAAEVFEVTKEFLSYAKELLKRLEENKIMINVTEKELSIVLDILKKHLNSGEVRAFGSRYKWTSKQHSDLDLAIVKENKMSIDELAIIQEAFEESELLFKVDVIDYQAVSSEFKKIIDLGYEVIYKVDGNKI